ncbi:MAG: helix-turn-helix domain-containing protein [Clostridiales bacterium]|nr:helix-turn-helix domain-containing protein [Clostridiales bacterium]
MRGFKYRIYPKENQILKLEEMFCAKRYVWNYFLELNMKRFEKITRYLNLY